MLAVLLIAALWGLYADHVMAPCDPRGSVHVCREDSPLGPPVYVPPLPPLTDQERAALRVWASLPPEVRMAPVRPYVAGGGL